MNREDIIRMAREAGLANRGTFAEYWEGWPEQLERFAALVVAAEREACAKLCEDYDDDRGTGETWGPRFAALIRARGEHMTTIHFWCPLRRAYVSMQVPTETAFKLVRLT